jgi:hypothetical protein
MVFNRTRRIGHETGKSGSGRGVASGRNRWLLHTPFALRWRRRPSARVTVGFVGVMDIVRSSADGARWCDFSVLGQLPTNGLAAFIAGLSSAEDVAAIGRRVLKLFLRVA